MKATHPSSLILRLLQRSAGEGLILPDAAPQTGHASPGARFVLRAGDVSIFILPFTTFPKESVPCSPTCSPPAVYAGTPLRTRREKRGRVLVFNFSPLPGLPHNCPCSFASVRRVVGPRHSDSGRVPPLLGACHRFGNRRRADVAKTPEAVARTAQKFAKPRTNC